MDFRRRFTPNHAATVAASAISAVLALVSSCVLAQRHAEVPIHISGRTPVVDVYVNGMGPYHFLVDTGSLYPQIDSELANELQLRAVHIGSGADGKTATSSDSISGYRIDSLRLGDLQLSDVIVRGWDSHSLSPGGEAPQGILGTSLFDGSLVTIDNPKRLFRVEPGQLPPADDKDVLDYELTDEAPTIPARIGDVQLQLALHTGGFGPLQLRSEQQAQLELRTPPAKIGNISIDGVTGDVFGSRIVGALHLGQHVIVSPSVHFCEAYPMDHLGSGALSNFVITLDPANRRVRLTAQQSADELLTSKAAEVPSLVDEGLALKEAFNRGVDKTRLIVILSPT